MRRAQIRAFRNERAAVLPGLIWASLLLCGAVHASFRTADSRPLAGEPNGTGVAVGDFNGDGQLDLASAGYWYTGPELRTPHTIPGPAWQACYASGNSLLVVADNELAIFENPGWKRRVLLQQVSPIATLDTKLGFVGIVAGKAGFAGSASWEFQALGDAVAVGVGDVDGDGDRDILTDTGWYANPEWTFHVAGFAARSQILCLDVDLDGLQDVIVAQEKGLAWFQQGRDKDGNIHFGEQRIPSPPGAAYDEPPAIAIGGFNYGDQDSLITGNADVTYILQRKSWRPRLIDNRHGVGTQIVVADFDQNGYSEVISAQRVHVPRIENTLPHGRRGDSLFDGFTLGDWWSSAPQNWRVENGEIIGKGQLVSDLELGSFRLIAEVTVSGNARITPRGQPGRSELPHTLELAGACWKAGWNTVEIVASGDRLLYAINACPGAAGLEHQSGRLTIDLLPERQAEFRMRNVALTLNPEFELLTAQPNTPDGLTDLTFESGTLQGWTASGDAFLGQPLASGDSGHAGTYWIGTGTHLPGVGVLTSKPVTVSASHCSFLIGGVDSKVEILGPDGAVLHRVIPDGLAYMSRAEVELSGHETVVFRLVDPSPEAYLNIDDIRFHGPSPPLAERALDLDFESGSIAGWTARGDAFHGQPIRGDTLVKRGAATSGHQGEYWVGSAERLGNAAIGTLRSKPLTLAKPIISLLLAGTADCQVEIRRAADDSVLSRLSGTGRVGLEPVYMDLRSHVGTRIVFAIVDASSKGQICIDDIQFLDKDPRPQPPTQ